MGDSRQRRYDRRVAQCDNGISWWLRHPIGNANRTVRRNSPGVTTLWSVQLPDPERTARSIAMNRRGSRHVGVLSPGRVVRDVMARRYFIH